MIDFVTIVDQWHKNRWNCNKTKTMDYGTQKPKKWNGKILNDEEDWCKSTMVKSGAFWLMHNATNIETQNAQGEWRMILATDWPGCVCVCVWFERVLRREGSGCSTVIRRRSWFVRSNGWLENVFSSFVSVLVVVVAVFLRWKSPQEYGVMASSGRSINPWRESTLVDSFQNLELKGKERN